MPFKNTIIFHLRTWLFIFFVFSLAGCLNSFYYIYTVESSAIKKTLIKISNEVEQKLMDIELELNHVFNGDERIVNDLASDISSGKLPLKQIPDQLRDIISRRDITAIGAFFSDHYDKPSLRKSLSDYRVHSDIPKELYAPYFKAIDNNKATIFPYDYTDKNLKNQVGWYEENMSTGHWYGPFFGTAASQFLISYRAPIEWSSVEKRNKGTVIAVYSLQRVREIIQNIKLLDSGYCVIINTNGEILSHPVKRYISKNIADISGGTLSIEKIQQLTPNQFNEINLSQTELNKERQGLIYRRDFAAKNWIALVILNKYEAIVGETGNEELGSHYKFSKQLHYHKIYLIVLSQICVTFLLFYLLWNHPYRNRCLSIVFSVINIAAMVFIWYIDKSDKFYAIEDAIVIKDDTSLEASLNAFNRQIEYRPEPMKERIKVKTGFFIQSINFSSSNNIFVTGYAWQKVPERLKTEARCQKDMASCLGFIFPEAEHVNMQQVSSSEKVIRWYFEVSLRQEFDYLKYPLDEEDVWIRARPKDFYNNKTLLIPDFESYPSFYQFSLIGLENDIFIEGWNIEKTYYSFKQNTYSTNFGEEIDLKVLDNRPDLYFNISINRELLGAFVAYIIPVLVIAFLLYAVIMIRTNKEDVNLWLGFKSSTVLAYAASLFFVLVVTHMSMRETLNAKGIIYLEFLYFALYIAIAIVSVNSIIFSFKQANQKHQKQVLTYLYWPMLTLSLFIATVVRFT